MQHAFLEYLKCPVTRSRLTIAVKKIKLKTYENKQQEYIDEAILWADQDWFFPVVNGIPRLTVESLFEYEDFLRAALPDFDNRKKVLLEKFNVIIKKAEAKNKRTKKSFAEEWSFFNYESDTTWGAGAKELVPRFLEETNETADSIKGKLIFDAGCGNGLLDTLIGKAGATVLAMDLGKSIERAFEQNDQKNVCYIQGDLQFPPVAFDAFDIVHSSGVLHHTNNTELSFNIIAPCVKPQGKLSVWLYTPRPSTIDRILHFVRKYSSQLPLKLQYVLYYVFILPPVYIGSRIKGSKLNVRELMVNIYDSLSCEFCWLHQPEEVGLWFTKQQFSGCKITTQDKWGFNIIGVKTTTSTIHKQ